MSRANRSRSPQPRPKSSRGGGPMTSYAYMPKNSSKGGTDPFTEEKSESMVRIHPLYYIHVLDVNSNIVRVEEGPQNFVKKDHEQIVKYATKMLCIPDLHYCIVDSPAIRDENGHVVIDEENQLVKLQYGQKQVRTNEKPFDEPFPLYPGETATDVKKMDLIPARKGIVLEAQQDFDDHKYGDRWQLEGPVYYLPHIYVKKVEETEAIVVTESEALRIRALRDCNDNEGNRRVAGEEWMVTELGAYMLGVNEELIDIVDRIILTDRTALHLRALTSFKDVYDMERKIGEECLVTQEYAHSHVPSVNEEVIDIVELTTLTSRQYCVVLDPVDQESGKNRLGSKKLVVGPETFFLEPGESLEDDVVCDVYILGENEGLVLCAQEEFEDTYLYSIGRDLPDLEKSLDDPQPVLRKPGDKWMLEGPCEYVPPVEVEVIKRTKAIPLDTNEGVYVQNLKTGGVRAVHGETFMLDENEVLWEKPLRQRVEILVDAQLFARSFRRDFPMNTYVSPRDRTKLVCYRVPHNSVIQVHDYRENLSRVIFGPDLVTLGPYEEITPIMISGGTPKSSRSFITTLALLLGPYKCTDQIEVNTADHTKLSVKLQYNWKFVVDKEDPVDASKLFAVPDFIGDLTNVCAAKVRGRVAQIKFDAFHKNSAQIIESAVFGTEEGKEHRDVVFKSNNLHVTSIDVQTVKPVDKQTELELSKSVTNAIKITTDSQEASASQEAKKREQHAQGALERQKLNDSIDAEIVTKQLVELEAERAAVESCGQAKAEADARSEAMLIEAKEAVEIARIRADAARIEFEAELRIQKMKNDQQLDFMRQQNALQLQLRQKMAEIESKKFVSVVNSLHPETIRAIACARQDLKVKMIQGLGIESTLLTDGKSPVNLFNTANGLLGENRS